MSGGSLRVSALTAFTVPLPLCMLVRRDNLTAGRPPVSSSSSGSSSPVMFRTRSEENIRLPERSAVSGHCLLFYYTCTS